MPPFLSWEGVQCVGRKVLNSSGDLGDGWCLNAVQYRHGYKCTRKVYDEKTTKFYVIICEIYNTALIKPLFQCIIMDGDLELPKIIATNPTTAVKKVLQVIDVKRSKIYNGNNFFGLHREDVKKLQRCNDDSILITDLENESSQKCGTISPVIRKAAWMGVVSLGVPYNDPLYKVIVGAKTFRIQPGYEALRQLRKEDQVFLVHCLIEPSALGPQFVCKTTSEPIVCCSSHNISTVVKDVFMKLDVSTQKKWSGYEFFGLTNSEVLTNICEPSNLISDNCNGANTKKLCNYRNVLSEANNIRIRNTGPTSDLSSKQAQRKRNDVIHKLVEFILFGDVKGIMIL